MLTPEYLEQVGSDLSDLYYDLETEIIADIAERLKLNGDRMTTTAEYLVMKLEQMGYQHDYIQRRLASIMNISEQKVSQILEDSTYQSMRDSLQRAKTYESVDGSSISFDEQILQSKTAINAELKNLTNSTARMATNTMLRTFDDAYMKVSSGAYSLNQAVDQAIKELIDTGIGQVTYRSGTKRNIDTAVRVAVRTGVNQNALKCEEQVLEATEHNLVVVSAHMGARPSHAEWQGKIYWRDHPEGNYENFEEATGYGTGAGLGGWNCRHQFFAYYPEMGNPYEDVDTKDNQEVYELTQQQRYNERMIRKWKRRKVVYEKAGLDTTLENQKIREWTERNNALIKSSKYLKRQYANEKSYTVRPSSLRSTGPYASQYYRNLNTNKNDINLVKRTEDIKLYRLDNFKENKMYVSEQALKSLKRKQVHKINTRVSESLKLINGKSEWECPKVYIVSEKEMATGAIASYNRVLNAVFVTPALGGNPEKVKKYQGIFAKSDNVISTPLHEMFHWKDAMEYKDSHGKVDGTSNYLNLLNVRHKKILDKLGIDSYNVGEISKYAKSSYALGDYYEVYTEYRVKEKMEEGRSK